MADTVERRGLAQLLRDGEEHLPHQERAEGRGQERHDQTLVAVDPPEESIVRWLTTMVSFGGTSKVARKRTNVGPLPGKSRKTNAYAASTLVTITPDGDSNRDDDAVDQQPAEVADPPRGAQGVEREVDRQQRAGWSIASGPLFNACINVA